jgi:hypothetical protein
MERDGSGKKCMLVSKLFHSVPSFIVDLPYDVPVQTVASESVHTIFHRLQRIPMYSAITSHAEDALVVWCEAVGAVRCQIALQMRVLAGTSKESELLGNVVEGEIFVQYAFLRQCVRPSGSRNILTKRFQKAVTKE